MLLTPGIILTHATNFCSTILLNKNKISPLLSPVCDIKKFMDDKQSNCEFPYDFCYMYYHTQCF